MLGEVDALDQVTILANKYQILTKIGSGSFGEIFLARNIKSGEDVAVKVENRVGADGKVRHGHSQLKREAKVYSKLSGEVGVSRIRWLGLGADRHWMVMDLLGRSLEDLFNYCGRRFSLKTVTILACELICRIESIHNRHLIHRDIKPENFLMGRGIDRHTVFVIDFGLSKLYLNPQTGRHIPQRNGYSLTGTARYASVKAHLGIEMSRRDDLMSIGYVLIYFLKGALPWQGMSGKTSQEKYQLILEKKQSTTNEELCADVPDAFLQYFSSVSQLSFEETPDYGFLKRLFQELFRSQQFTYDKVLYDWEILHLQRQRAEKEKGG